MTKKQLQKPEHYLYKSNKAKEQTRCLNCGTLHAGKYCHNCGQSSERINKPLIDFISEFFSSLYAFDFRLWRSILVLFSRPGRLSSEYLKGRIARYMHPFKFYFFVSFIFFFLAQWLTNTNIDKAEGIKREDVMLTLSSEKDSLLKSEEDVAGFIEDDEEAQKFMQLSDSIVANKDSASVGMLNFSEGKIKQLISDKQMQKSFVQKLYKSLSWILFILMPIFALILALLYIRRKHYFIKHLVFAVNFHTQSFLILILLFILNHYLKSMNVSIQNSLILLIPIYLYVGMKNFYKQGWVKTFIKFWMVSWIYLIVLIVASVSLLVVNLGVL